MYVVIFGVSRIANGSICGSAISGGGEAGTGVLRKCIPVSFGSRAKRWSRIVAFIIIPAGFRYRIASRSVRRCTLLNGRICVFGSVGRGLSEMLYRAAIFRRKRMFRSWV